MSSSMSVFYLLLTQIAHQPLTWKQLHAFQHWDIVKPGQINLICMSVSVFKGAGPWVFQKLLNNCNFCVQSSPRFTDSPRKSQYPVCDCCVLDHASLISEGQKVRMVRLIGDQRKATLIQITTDYIWGLQRTNKPLDVPSWQSDSI